MTEHSIWSAFQAEHSGRDPLLSVGLEGLKTLSGLCRHPCHLLSLRFDSARPPAGGSFAHPPSIQTSTYPHLTRRGRKRIHLLLRGGGGAGGGGAGGAGGGGLKFKLQNSLSLSYKI